MDPGTFLTLIVPALAIIAGVDSIIGISVLISRKLRRVGRLLIHVILLFICLIIFLITLRYAFPYSPWGFKYYLNIENHRFSLFIAPKLLIAEFFFIPCCMVIALLISIRQRRNVLLSVAAAMLGNIGTLIWMVRNGMHPDQPTAPHLVI
jgi:hypothetical protein